MLALIRSNIEARYVSRSPGSTDILLDEQENICARAIYLSQTQHYHHAAGGKKIILHLLQGVGELIIQQDGNEEKEQLLKGDLLVLKEDASYTINNVTSTVLIMSEIAISINT